MDFEQFYKNILNDVKTEVMEEFDRNFERKAFFDKTWPRNKLVNRKGSIMARSNNLRRGFRAKIQGDKIVFSNSMPYAKIQNEGGEILVTHRMKKYFWAMYYQANQSQRHNVRRTASNTARNNRLSVEAEQFKALALMPVGKKIKIPSRRVIGPHPIIRDSVERIVNNHLSEINEQILNNLRQ